jgi:YebC/PmpR family DNA-binding regulatory protein
MSGHNKWSKIKHKKGKEDAKRGKIFSRVIKELTIAARIGGGEPTGNPRLAAAITNAKANNMPKDTIERAISRGAGDQDGIAFEEFAYEGYGPGGVAIMVEVMTDNRNRTVAAVRHVFAKYGGNLGEAGCVSFLFEKKGVISLPKEDWSEDALMELLLEVGASDYVDADETWEIYTEVGDFHDVRVALEVKEIKLASAELAALPTTNVKLEERQAQTLLKLISKLEDLDDVQNVYANFDIDEQILEQFEG